MPTAAAYPAAVADASVAFDAVGDAAFDAVSDVVSDGASAEATGDVPMGDTAAAATAAPIAAAATAAPITGGSGRWGYLARWSNDSSAD